MIGDTQTTMVYNPTPNFEAIIKKVLTGFTFDPDDYDDIYNELWVTIEECRRQCQNKGSRIQYSILYRRARATLYAWQQKNRQSMTSLDDNYDIEGDEQATDTLLLQDLLKTLSPRSRRIVKYYYGISCKQKTVSELAKKYKLSERRIYKIIEQSRQIMGE